MTWNLRGNNLESFEHVSDLLNIGGTDLVGLQDAGTSRQADGI